MGVHALTDYGAAELLKYFNTGTFSIALLTAHGLGATQAAVDDEPAITEVTAGQSGYARKSISDVSGNNGAEWQNTAGTQVAAPDFTTNTAIAAYKWTRDTTDAVLSWVFTGPITGPSITGYAVLKSTASTPPTVGDILFVQAFDNAFTPYTNNDTLTIDSISIRLAKFTGAATFS